MVYVHKTTSQPRIDVISSYGATVKVVNGWEIISDTSWPGYQEISTWIMQGYTTIVSEIQEQFSAQGILRPQYWAITTAYWKKNRLFV